jgi:peptide/nickel transport system substrate-binding protein
VNKYIVVLFVLSLCAVLLIGCSTSATSTTTASTKPVATSASTTSPAAITTSMSAPSMTATAATKPVSPVTSNTPSTPLPAASLSPVYGGTLRYIMASGPGSPIGWPREAVGPALGPMLIGAALPLEEDAKGNLNPRLASSYKVDSNPDNPSITLVFRKGLKFQDGTPLTAKEAKWNFTQVLTGTMASSAQYWKSFDVLDDYTLRINLKSWQNRHTRAFASAAATLISPTAYEKNGLDWIRWNIVGAGAFKQTEFLRDVSAKFEKYDDYYEQGKPYLQGIQLLFVTDELTRLALFKSGGGDVLGISPIRASELQSAGYRFITAANAVTWNLIPDSVNKDSPWANPKVRLAVEYAIDKEGIAKTLGYGYWDAAYQIAYNTSNAYNPALTPRKYDLAKAKQALTEAGYPSGFKSSIIAQSGQSTDVLVAIQSQLKAIGINVDLQIVEAAKFASYQMGTWTNALLFSFSFSYPNYNNGLNQYFAPNGVWYQSLKKPANWQQLFDASLSSPAPVPELMQKCVQAFFDEVTLIPIYSVRDIWVTTDKVHDAGLGQLGDATQWTPHNAWLGK